jgi:FAD-dependent urate hydroxylase
MTTTDVTIIGAGPYGLSAAAHLRTIKALEVRVFGDPMSFWSGNMPSGMFLRSNWTATQIASPDGDLTLEAFQADRNISIGVPVSIEHFIQYGLWYQKRAVPDLDPRRIVRIERNGRGFNVTASDGEVFHSHRVIVACGIGCFAQRPAEFAGLPPSLVSHTIEHPDFGRYAGKRVLVVGSGQSALESAALLREAGAEVEVTGRAVDIHWLQGKLSRTLHHQLGKSVRALLYAPTDVGPACISQLLAKPHLVRRLPRALQDKLRRRATRPAGARWLLDRLRGVTITLGCHISSVSSRGDQATLRLSNGREITVDHVLLGTGFHIDITKYEFLSQELMKDILRVNGFPLLNSGLETSVPGLHVIGAPAAYSFGPLLQFVSGTRFASPAVTRAILQSRLSA